MLEQTTTALILCCALASLTLVLGCHLAMRLRPRQRASESPLPPVTILKPLKGVSRGLFENLASLAAQDYPKFEIVFGCESRTDPAIAIAVQIARDFPHVPMRVATGAPNIGYNPKVNNLRHMERRAEHDVLLISDADVRVGPDYLRRIVVELDDPEVGLVCNGFSGVGDRSVGATLENLHLGGFVTGTIFGSAAATGRPVVVGKSMLFRRSDLAAIGGWDALADVLAEDFAFGNLLEQRGRRVALSRYVVPVVNKGRRLGEFWARHVRWGQMRRHIVPRLYWFEPLLLPSPWLLALLVIDAGAGPLTLLSLAGLGLRAASDLLIVRHLHRGSAHLGVLPLSIVKDFLALGTWLVGAFKTTVEWRGNVFRIGSGSLLSPVDAGAALETAATNRA